MDYVFRTLQSYLVPYTMPVPMRTKIPDTLWAQANIIKAQVGFCNLIWFNLIWSNIRSQIKFKYRNFKSNQIQIDKIFDLIQKYLIKITNIFDLIWFDLIKSNSNQELIWFDQIQICLIFDSTLRNPSTWILYIQTFCNHKLKINTQLWKLKEL